jgi:hypothetical protein
MRKDWTRTDAAKARTRTRRSDRNRKATLYVAAIAFAPVSGDPFPIR